MRSTTLLMVFALGLVFGVVVGLPLSLYGIGTAVDNLVNAASVIVLLVFLIALLVFVAFIFRNSLNRGLFRGAEARLENTIIALFSTGRASLGGDHELATEQMKIVTNEFVAWYSWSKFYRWSTATAIGLLVAFGGFAGTILLVKQNEILTEQLDKLNDQTDLFRVQSDLFKEQNRSLVRQTEFTEEQTVSLGKQNELLEIQNEMFQSQLRDTRKSSNSQLLAGRIKDLVSEASDTSSDKISPALIANIQSLATSLESTDAVSYGKETMEVSREKGILLSTLLSAGFRFELTEPQQLDFSGAAFDNSDLSETDFGNIVLDRSDLRNANFRGSDLSKASLSGSLLPDANMFENVNMLNTDFDEAIVPSDQWIEDLLRLSRDEPRNDETKLAFRFESWRVEKKVGDDIYALVEVGTSRPLSIDETTVLDSLESVVEIESVDMSELAEISNSVAGEPGIKSAEADVNRNSFIDPKIIRHKERGQIARLLCKFGNEGFALFYASGGNLEGATLLNGSKCSFGDIPGSSLRNAVLVDPTFIGVDLSDVDLYGTSLPYPYSFSSANLKNTNFNGAYVPSGNFLEALRGLPNGPQFFSPEEWTTLVVGSPKITKNDDGVDTIVTHYVVCKDVNPDNESIDCRN